MRLAPRRQEPPAVQKSTRATNFLAILIGSALVSFLLILYVLHPSSDWFRAHLSFGSGMSNPSMRGSTGAHTAHEVATSSPHESVADPVTHDSEPHEPEMPNVVEQREGLLSDLCDAFGEERCSELKANGNWPPFEADFDVHERRPLLEWNREGEQLFSYDGLSERAARYGVSPVFTLSERPRVEYFPRFFSAEEAKRLRDAAEPLLAPSGVGSGSGRRGGKARGRTSDGARLPRSDPKISALEKRIHNVTGFQGRYAERLYVLRYKATQLYHRHHDSSAEVPRAATFFAWLTDLPAPGGGWTSWPLANGRKQGAECENGLRVRPVLGAAALFYDLRPDGGIDHRAVHAGCPPVGNATKWGVTKWLQVNPSAFKRVRAGRLRGVE
eukprot:TRINITY_DN2962_c1_g1_i1.p1 TRINITY_DN2962_c1_g1~~TRINITY_DN2962_c1_g1_i1.p1  ORF type:complete len:385 (+),score=46.48 TRINITY_DN2962_c1_g1_i1:86-1240(+)